MAPLRSALTTPPPAAQAPRQPSATVPVPAALQRYHVEATPAAVYDALLVGSAALSASATGCSPCSTMAPTSLATTRARLETKLNHDTYERYQL